MKKEKFLYGLFLFAAFIAVISILLIFLFVGIRGFPIISKVGLLNFIFGMDWTPTEGRFGAFPLIVGSLLVTLGALVIGGPLGVSVAIFLAEIAPDSMRRIVRPAVELLAGIPSVVYGFFGIVVIVPIIRKLVGGSGFGFLTGSVVLAVMILPTITTLSEDAIRAVPKKYTVGSLGLGATKWQTIRHVVLPVAAQGIISAIILGIGRAIGETMAVLMVLGNAPIIPTSLSDPMTTMTSVIALDMSYASGDHQVALFALGLILFLFSTSLVAIVRIYQMRGKVK